MSSHFDKQPFRPTGTDFGLAAAEWLHSEEVQSLTKQALDVRWGRAAVRE